MATNGLVLIKPTSTAVTGGSASATINAGGSVTFTTCETLSLNGVFSATYDNYVIDMRVVASVDNDPLLRYRASGTDNTTASSYVSQRFTASSTTVGGTRTTADYAVIGRFSDDQRDGMTIYVYGPYLTQPTAARSINVSGESGGLMANMAWTHNQSTAYDGVTIYRTGGQTLSGLIKVYGLVQ